MREYANANTGLKQKDENLYREKSVWMIFVREELLLEVKVFMNCFVL